MSIRKMMIELLENFECNALDISRELSIREKEVYGHLDHIRRSLHCQNRELVITPYECLGCGFVFKKRTRLDRPGRCPKCKEGYINMATYKIP